MNGTSQWVRQVVLRLLETIFHQIAVKQPVSPTVTCHSHYSVMEHFNAHHALVKPTKGVFDYYIRIDTGEGIDDDWPIQLKHPSKCNVKVTDDEIQLFCTGTFDDVICEQFIVLINLEGVTLMERPIHQTVIVQTKHLW